MIKIDGSYGEGGGQILRSSLALSLITGKPFEINNIRTNRRKPGLMRQHLTCVNAAVEIGGAKCSGNIIGSTTLEFNPGEIESGEYEFKIGTAGSATLVLQSVLPALLKAEGKSKIVLEGGTHNPMAPPFDFLAKSFIPVLNKMGADIKVDLENYGFYPAGGGRFTVEITPFNTITPLDLSERGEIKGKRAVSIVTNLPDKICDRELNVIRKKLLFDGEDLISQDVENSKGPGNVLTVEIESENITEVFTGFGIKGVKAEQVANGVVKKVKRYLSKDAPVFEYLADQLLIPFAMAGSGSFRTVKPTNHTITNIDIIQKFLDVTIEIVEINEDIFEIKVTR
ncbi:MAG: RNA 3'-terminal phosphate cyclase [Desulfobacterales bacterium]|nr:RNA 3'-terminal phosphate cyclase [Desulfobacterales bacterium]